MKISLWLAAAVVSAGLTSASFAQVTGKVTLEGQAPAAENVDMSGVKDCAAKHADPVKDPTVVTDGKGGLANVIVSIKKEEGQELPGEAPKEAAVLDHYSALISAVVAKLQGGERTARARDAVGGSTYRFDIWDGHPLEDEVLGLLQQVREQASTLRARVENHAGASAPPPGARTVEVTFYGGQSVMQRDRNGGSSE